MKCSKCGKRISKKFKLCPNCGTKEEIKKEVHKISKKTIFIVGGVLLLSLVVLYFILFNSKVDFDDLKKSVVLINVYDSDNELISTGSGVVAFENDIILTNAHVIEDNYKIEVISENNTKYQVDGVLDYNKKKDIAILKLTSSKGLKKVKIGKKVKSGSEVTAIGSPLGLKNTISTGIISAMFQDNIEVYQHTAPISHGSSGGALFDRNGKLIGITYASITEGQNLNLAIPIDYFKKSYNKVKSNDTIDTQYYRFLNNRILKEYEGNKLLQYILNDKFSNVISNIIPHVYANPQLYKQGYYKKYTNPSEDYKKEIEKGDIFIYDYNPFDNSISKYVETKFQISSGNRGLFIDIRISPDDEIDAEYDTKTIIEPNYYSIEIYKIIDSSKIKDVINYLKNDYREIDEEYYFLSSKQYVAAYACVNYNDCDTVKKLVENIVNQ